MSTHFSALTTSTPVDSMVSLAFTRVPETISLDDETHARATVPLFQKSPAAEWTLEALHAALAAAAEGLPVTLDELLEAFGEEGAADWAEGYIPHCRPEFLRAFAVAVSERLTREQMDLAKNAGVHECQKYQKPAAYQGPAAAACRPAIDGVSLSWSD